MHLGVGLYSIFSVNVVRPLHLQNRLVLMLCDFFLKYSISFYLVCNSTRLKGKILFTPGIGAEGPARPYLTNAKCSRTAGLRFARRSGYSSR